MPLNYLNLHDQISHMAEAAVSRQQELTARLLQCQALLHDQAENLIRLQEKVEKAAAKDKNLRCAVPVSEPLDAHFPAPMLTLDCTILSADGSQITPNPHEAVFYGVVNVGVFQMRPGSGQAPTTQTFTELIYEESDPNEHERITEELINLQRDVKERKKLAELARVLPAPLVTLTDGPLELYHEPGKKNPYKRYLDEYLAALDDLALLNVVTAGYVDRPRAALLVNLLELAALDDASDEPPGHPFAGLSDLAIMRQLLQPGERSAIFALQSSSCADFDGRKALHFFYLNVGSAVHPAIARVELPLWVVQSPASIDLLHAVLLDQAHQSGAHPYPYALLRAHETAVVKMDESEALKLLIQKELLQRGIPLMNDSEKLANKKVGARTRY
ncbi:MAG: DNA double-strand break repair nuclease NurA [Anaerolineaceae bacterium]